RIEAARRWTAAGERWFDERDHELDQRGAAIRRDRSQEEGVVGGQRFGGGAGFQHGHRQRIGRRIDRGIDRGVDWSRRFGGTCRNDCENQRLTGPTNRDYAAQNSSYWW